jgi:hypothetical protein
MLNGTCHCGAVNWSLDGDPSSITACNCTLCRRYGALSAYDYEGERIRIWGPSSVYTRSGKARKCRRLTGDLFHSHSIVATL